MLDKICCVTRAKVCADHSAPAWCRQAFSSRRINSTAVGCPIRISGTGCREGSTWTWHASSSSYALACAYASFSTLLSSFKRDKSENKEHLKSTEYHARYSIQKEITFKIRRYRYVGNEDLSACRFLGFQPTILSFPAAESFVFI